MAALSESRLLTIWEAAVERPPLSRALVLAIAGGAPPADVADLSIGHRDQYILALRQDWFGEVLRSVVDCPACGEELELELGSAEVNAGPPVEDWGAVAADDVDVEFRLITSQDLLAVAGMPDARRQLIERCVTSARRGANVVTSLSDSVLDAVSAAMSTLDPQADVFVDLDCAVCGHRWGAPFDIAGYLWAELNARANRLLRDVHSLATVYGWSEADVLAVSPARRRCYLEMASP
jgi:hypothetical protein